MTRNATLTENLAARQYRAFLKGPPSLTDTLLHGETIRVYSIDKHKTGKAILATHNEIYKLFA